MDSTISFYKQVTKIKSSDGTSVFTFLNDVKDGKWQDEVLAVRLIKDEELQSQEKEKLPSVTLSGFFIERTDKGLSKHSGFIGMDIDYRDPEEIKGLLKKDKYVFAIFTSIRGKGVCALFRINGEKHREAFYSIGEYLKNKYQIVVDPKCVNPSRARFVSYDPHLYLNPKAEKFTAVVKKKAEKKHSDVVYVESDFENIIKEIEAKEIDITPDYGAWLRVGFAIADKFREGGRQIFHRLSKFNSTYDVDLCDRQYTKCLESRGEKDEPATIGTIYYYAKEKGIKTISDRTKLISQAAYYAKKGGRTIESVIKYLFEAEQIPEAESRPIIEQVFEKNIKIATDDTLLQQTQNWLKSEYEIKRNAISRKVEVDGREMDDIVFNNIFCQAKIIFDQVNAELLQRIINSDFIPTYNPILEFFEKYKDTKPQGVIKTFYSAIKSDNGYTEANFFPEFVEYFGKRWLVGMIAAAHGQHCPLMLVLSGPQGNGKTEFFRRLLPDELAHYFAESKMDNEKDDTILMTKKWIIYDDEMSGKSKKEESRMKMILSKQIVTIREPYGRYAVDLKRLAVFAGSTNDQEILNDPTGNRRIIPIHVDSINYDVINSVDRIELLMEAYWLYKSGFQWQLSGNDIKILNDNTQHFEQPSIELELLTKYFEVATDDDEREQVQFLTPAEIKSKIEGWSLQKLNITKIGKEIKKMGAEKKPKKRAGTVVYGYRLIEKTNVVDSGRQSVDRVNNVSYQPANY